MHKAEKGPASGSKPKQAKLDGKHEVTTSSAAVKLKPAYDLNTQVGVYELKGKGYKLMGHTPLIEFLTDTDYDKDIKAYRVAKANASTKEEKEAAAKLKSKIVSCTPSGYYPKRRMKSAVLKNFTHLLHIDLDHLVNPAVEVARRLFEKYSWIAVAAVSCGGSGVYLLIPIPGVGAYEGCFHAVVELLSNEEELAVDDAVSSINELRYKGLSSEVYLRYDATTWTETREAPVRLPAVTLNDEGHRELAELLGEDLRYPDLVRYVGSANARGASRAQILENALKANFRKASHLYNNPKGIEDAVNSVCDQYTDQFNTVAPVPKLVFNRLHGLGDEIIVYSDLDLSLSYLKGFHLRALDDKDLAELFVFSTEEKKPSYETFVRRLIANSPRYNPIEVFFGQELDPDLTDQFEVLGQYLTFEVEDEEQEKYREFFVNHLRKHFIRGIDQFFKRYDKDAEPSRYVFVFQGPKHIGKSTLLRGLTLFNVVSGFCSEVSFEDKEIHLRMTQLLNLINEEVDSVTRKELSNQKSLISYPGGLIRPAYHRQASFRPRIATLWASVNPSDFLNSGDDRWIVIPVKSIDFKYVGAVNFTQLWLQAYAAWKANNLSGRLTSVELIALRTKTDEFIYYTATEQILNELYKPLDKSDPVTIVSKHDIRETLSIYSDTPINDTALGMACTKLWGQHSLGRKRFAGKLGVLYKLKKVANPNLAVASMVVGKGSKSA